MMCELVNQLEAIGISINLRVDQVKLTIPSTLNNGILLMLKELKARKKELIEFLKNKENDVLAKSSGFMIGISGELYTLTLFEKANGLSSMVFIEREGDVWQSWRETFKKGERRALWVKSISHTHNFTTAINGARSDIALIKGY